jgi:hypothetical protein
MDSRLKFKRKVHHIDFSIKPPTTREDAIKIFSEMINGFPEDYEFNMIIVGSAKSQLIPIDDNAIE